MSSRTAECRRVLLATSSLAAIMLGWGGAAQAACITNPATPFTNNVAIDCVTWQDSLTHTGDVVNSSTGVITAPGGPGLIGLGTGISLFTAGTTINGNIINNGTITSVFTNFNSPINGIGVSAGLNPGSLVTGSITNNNSIIVTGVGIYVGSDVGGSIINNKTMNTGWSAIQVTGTNSGTPVVIGGSVVNNGTITFTPHGTVNFPAGDNPAHGIEVFVATVNGDVGNSGSITTLGQTGIVVGGATIGGMVYNSGTITATGTSTNTSVQSVGMGIYGSTVNAVQNTNTITADVAGIWVGGTSSVTTNVTNGPAGSITVNKGVGILVSNLSPTGITTGASTISGQVVNQGTIAAKTGIKVVGSTISGGIFNTGSIMGTTAAIDLTAEATATTVNQAAGTISGNILLSGLGDIVNITGGTLSNIVGPGSSGTVNFAPSSGSFTYASTISGVAAVNINSGLVSFTGTNTYTGVTNVNGGATLDVEGSTATSSLTTVNNNALLMGTGTVGATTVASGGTLAPGNGIPGTSLNVSGSLAFQSGALYLVTVNPTTSSFTQVTGSAILNGATVQAIFANGSYVQKKYTIVTATGGVGGTFNPNVINSNLPANFKTSLSYDANDVFLNLQLNFSVPGGLNGNQQAVANALTNFFNTTGGIPFAFIGLTPAGLTQASGELATGSQQTTFDAMGLFMGLLTDPFMARSGSGAASAGATPFADEIDAANAYARDPSRTTSERDAYAAIYRKASPAAPFVPSWSVWAAGYGGSQTTDGNVAQGSNTATSRIAGTAVGADYRFAPNTIAGVALAGGGTNFSIANALGTGRSDLFQAGVYLRHTEGPIYISAALAYGWQDITTNRTVTIAGFDQLQAKFNANAWSGRAEEGYRFVAPWMGVTPYAAVQSTTFDLPAYAEHAIVGANTFALTYNARSVTDTRSELGIRTDKSWAMTDSIFTLRGRFAWAHDFNPDRNIGTTFQALPGASFVVNGAPQAHESALTTASAEVKWINGWSAAATFEGEFSQVTRSYAGKGVVRYTW